LKRFIVLLASIGVLLFPAFTVSMPAAAIDVIDPACQNPNAQQSSVCKEKNSDANPLFGPDGVLTTVVNVLSMIAGVLAIFVILIGGVKFITSAGDSTSVASAKRAVLYAVISLVIVAFAQVMVRFVLNRL
jgi:hypothetical protein